MEKSKFDRYPRLTITGLILIGLVLVLFILELSLRFISPIAVSNVGFVDTINGKIYVFGIAMTKNEKEKVISEAGQIHGVKDVIPSIYLVEELSRHKN